MNFTARVARFVSHWVRSEPLTVRRLLVVLGFLILFPLHQAFIRLGWGMDRLFFGKRIAGQCVVTPVFLTGCYRSGTTLLHRMLAGRCEQFSTMTLKEILFAPSLSAKLALGIKGPPAKRNNFPSRWLSNPAHHTSLDTPEEDEYLLLHQFHSLAVGLSSGIPSLARDSLNFDSQPERDFLMSYYHDCLRCHLAGPGKGKTYLAKNPALACRLDSLIKEFPDARILVILRHPVRTLNSFHDMMRRTWSTIGADPDSPGKIRFLATIVISFCHSLRSFPSRHPEARVAFLRFEDLVANPDEYMDLALRQLGLPPAGNHPRDVSGTIPHTGRPGLPDISSRLPAEILRDLISCQEGIRWVRAEEPNNPV